MRKTLVVLLCVAGLCLQQVQAQLSDKLVPHLGFMYEVVNLQGFVPSSTNPAFRDDISRFFYTFSVGTYYVLAHQNDVVSLGLDPSLNLGFNFEQNFQGTETGINLVVQAPVFLMGRLGALATKYNQQKFGIGAGIGGNYIFVSEGIRDRRISGFAPSAVAEVTFLSRGGPLTIRGHFTIAPTEETYMDTSGSDDWRYNELVSWGVGLIYGF
ncbi:MAG: hypothetical protein AAF655_05130 [Bacteroidota bacterium]